MGWLTELGEVFGKTFNSHDDLIGLKNINTNDINTLKQIDDDGKGYELSKSIKNGEPSPESFENSELFREVFYKVQNAVPREKKLKIYGKSFDEGEDSINDLETSIIEQVEFEKPLENPSIKDYGFSFDKNISNSTNRTTMYLDGKEIGFLDEKPYVLENDGETFINLNSKNLEEKSISLSKESYTKLTDDKEIGKGRGRALVLGWLQKKKEQGQRFVSSDTLLTVENKKQWERFANANRDAVYINQNASVGVKSEVGELGSDGLFSLEDKPHYVIDLNKINIKGLTTIAGLMALSNDVKADEVDDEYNSITKKVDNNSKDIENITVEYIKTLPVKKQIEYIDKSFSDNKEKQKKAIDKIAPDIAEKIIKQKKRQELNELVGQINNNAKDNERSYIGDLGKGIGKGVLEAVINTSKLAVETLSSGKYDVINNYLIPKYLIQPLEELNAEIGRPQTLLGSFAKPTAQYMVGFLTPGRFATSTLSRAFATDFAVNYSVWSPEEQRISTMLKEHGFDNDIVDYLKNDINDTEFEGRWKNAVEGLALTTFAEGIFRTAKGLKNKWYSTKSQEEINVIIDEHEEKVMKGDTPEDYKKEEDIVKAKEEVEKIDERVNELMNKIRKEKEEVKPTVEEKPIEEPIKEEIVEKEVKPTVEKKVKPKKKPRAKRIKQKIEKKVAKKIVEKIEKQEVKPELKQIEQEIIIKKPEPVKENVKVKEEVKPKIKKEVKKTELIKEKPIKEEIKVVEEPIIDKEWQEIEPEELDKLIDEANTPEKLNKLLSQIDPDGTLKKSLEEEKEYEEIMKNDINYDETNKEGYDEINNDDYIEVDNSSYDDIAHKTDGREYRHSGVIIDASPLSDTIKQLSPEKIDEMRKNLNPEDLKIFNEKIKFLERDVSVENEDGLMEWLLRKNKNSPKKVDKINELLKTTDIEDMKKEIQKGNNTKNIIAIIMNKNTPQEIIDEIISKRLRSKYIKNALEIRSKTLNTKNTSKRKEDIEIQKDYVKSIQKTIRDKNLINTLKQDLKEYEKLITKDTDGVLTDEYLEGYAKLKEDIIDLEIVRDFKTTGKKIKDMDELTKQTEKTKRILNDYFGTGSIKTKKDMPNFKDLDGKSLNCDIK